MKKKLSFKDWADLNGYRTDGAYFAARAKQYEAYLFEKAIFEQEINKDATS